jgi:hypothetical protein
MNHARCRRRVLTPAVLLALAMSSFAACTDAGDARDAGEADSALAVR